MHLQAGGELYRRKTLFLDDFPFFSSKWDLDPPTHPPTHPLPILFGFFEKKNYFAKPLNSYATDMIASVNVRPKTARRKPNIQLLQTLPGQRGFRQLLALARLAESVRDTCCVTTRTPWRSGSVRAW